MLVVGTGMYIMGRLLLSTFPDLLLNVSDSGSTSSWEISFSNVKSAGGWAIGSENVTVTLNASMRERRRILSGLIRELEEHF